MKIEYNGLYFEMRKESLGNYAEKEYWELKNFGWKFSDGKVERRIRLDSGDEFSRYEVRIYSLKQAAKILNRPLIFGDKTQIEALYAARIFQIIFMREGWNCTTIPELKKRVEEEKQLKRDIPML